MRHDLLILAVIALAIAGCKHGEHEGAPSLALAGKTAGAEAKDTAQSGDYSLKGTGLQTAEDGSLKTFAYSATLGDTKAAGATISGKYAPVFLKFSKDGTAAGQMLNTARDGGGEDDNIRFLMSDASRDSKDNPTAFGLLVDNSAEKSFSAGALYGGRAPTNLPTSGTATYEGIFVGAANAGKGNSGVRAHLEGPFDLAADFGAGTVKGTIQGLRGPLDQTSPTAAAGMVTGIGFDGKMAADKASYSADKVTVTGEGVQAVSGAVQGGFFNAGGSETAGTLQATVSGSEPTNIIGAFHGEKPN